MGREGRESYVHRKIRKKKEEGNFQTRRKVYPGWVRILSVKYLVGPGAPGRRYPPSYLGRSYRRPYCGSPYSPGGYPYLVGAGGP